MKKIHRDSVRIEKVNEDVVKDKSYFVTHEEEIFDHKVSKIVDEICADKKRIVLLTGPSSSGKTTTANLIHDKLEEKGKNATVISLDDFYIDRINIKKNEKGEEDLETIEAFDIEELNRCFTILKENGKADFPTFSFILERRTDEVFEVDFAENTILILEGIHAHNDKVVEAIGMEGIYKVYIGAYTDFVVDGDVVISAKELRFARRMIRDCRVRNASIKITYDMWDSVLKGEDKWIKPLLKHTDGFINSVHLYEPMLYRDMLRNLMETSDVGEYEKEINKFYSKFEFFETVSKEDIPTDSLIREFIG